MKKIEEHDEEMDHVHKGVQDNMDSIYKVGGHTADQGDSVIYKVICDFDVLYS